MKEFPCYPQSSASRRLREELERQAAHFSADSLSRGVMDAIPSILIVLNDCHQIVYANRALLQHLGLELKAAQELHGARFGEVLGCVHAPSAREGCGSGRACQACGAFLAITAGEEAAQECRLLRRCEGRVEAMDLMVCATPLLYGGERFTIVVGQDISGEKRRIALERIFFHDILNLMGGIRGFAEILNADETVETREIAQLIHSTSERAIEEIEAQRALQAAESMSLPIMPRYLSSKKLLEQLLEIYRLQGVASGRRIILADDVEEVVFSSDRAILNRILGNMLKNALEACQSGDTVTLGSRKLDQGVIFWVHNPGEIPAHVQPQIFHRNFSTKGPGRGLGTYSMKLLSGHLRGEVSFISSQEEGTRFSVAFPLTLND